MEHRRPTLAVLSSKLDSSAILSSRNNAELKHDISNLKSGVQKLTDVLLEQRTRPI